MTDDSIALRELLEKNADVYRTKAAHLVQPSWSEQSTMHAKNTRIDVTDQDRLQARQGLVVTLPWLAAMLVLLLAGWLFF